MLVGILGDLHGPFEDKRKLDLCFDVFEHLGVGHIILNGDVLDFYSINAHGPKHPDVKENLESEFAWGIKFFKDLRDRFPKAKITFNAGNHEYRLDRFIMKYCPHFWNMLKLKNMLRLEELNIDYNEYNEAYKIPNSELYVQHSPPSYSENAAKTSLKKKVDCDHIWNCSHRTDMAVMTGGTGNVYTSYINGWFGAKTIIHDLQKEMPENRKVFNFAKNHESWNTSFCIASIVNGKHDVQQILIKDYRCSVGGIVYEG